MVGGVPVLVLSVAFGAAATAAAAAGAATAGTGVAAAVGMENASSSSTAPAASAARRRALFGSLGRDPEAKDGPAVVGTCGCKESRWRRVETRCLKVHRKAVVNCSVGKEGPHERR